jgi:hypothetical protein
MMSFVMKRKVGGGGGGLESRIVVLGRAGDHRKRLGVTRRRGMCQ